MTHTQWIESIGYISSIALPLFNIPLMIRILKRKSSQDLSLAWVLGVLSCLIGIQPAAWISPDFVFKVYNTINLILFSGVAFLVLFFRWRPNN